VNQTFKERDYRQESGSNLNECGVISEVAEEQEEKGSPREEQKRKKK